MTDKNDENVNEQKFESTYFPDPEQHADDYGVVAAGAFPEPKLLLDAYTHGIFPWPHDNQPLLWFSPDPRFIIYPEKARISRSLKKSIKKEKFIIKTDTQFTEVMRQCALFKRPDQKGTWIDADMLAGYTELHKQGYAHSIECYQNGKLVGGFYGVSVGKIFCGESMFALVADASKVAFATFLAHAFTVLDFTLIDCQIETEHLARFGAQEYTRKSYLQKLLINKKTPTKMGPWQLDFKLQDTLDFFAKSSNVTDKKE